MGLIDNFIQSTNMSKVALITSMFILYYIVAFKFESSHVFFIVLLGCIVYIIIHMGQKEGKTKHLQLDKFIDDTEKAILQHDTQEMVIDTVYSIHKPLKNLRFIKKNKEAQEIIYDLRFLKYYEKEDYIDIVIYLEYFLKIHFNLMIGKYDMETHFSILQDIRAEILNALFSCYHNIPKYSKTFDSPNLDDDLKFCIRRTQALTYRYMKIILKDIKYILP